MTGLDCKEYSSTKTQNLESGNGNGNGNGNGIRNTEYGIRNTEYGIKYQANACTILFSLWTPQCHGCLE